ncbi:arsenate reductase/protein-tyrosine-phosphatase family protein [Microbacterium sp. XT11]|uniref:arsenate reductase/protein-tyrosine-phosphatase family protein n=1 Tax=Microbacterium sp. XT11 TaxID=367477 RepID=UPI000742D128|nr:hypothetical protein [Microbacterium sp. XT11]ALX66283.1 protein-tyrosine-phosphatase [Microbacterium sp. XT11]
MSSILTVCDANVCRSVAAELMLASEFALHSSLADITVESRGANALTAHSACRMVADLNDDEPWLRRVRAHQSRQLDADAVEAAELILTASVGSRAAVVSLVPGARRRVFTLREALWLGAGYRPASGAVGDDLVRDFAAHLDAGRGLRQLPQHRVSRWRTPSNPLDIADGHAAGRRAHTATLTQVQQTVSELVRLLIQDPTLPFLATGRETER